MLRCTTRLLRRSGRGCRPVIDHISHDPSRIRNGNSLAFGSIDGRDVKAALQEQGRLGTTRRGNDWADIGPTSRTGKTFRSASKCSGLVFSSLRRCRLILAGQARCGSCVGDDVGSTRSAGFRSGPPETQSLPRRYVAGAMVATTRGCCGRRPRSAIVVDGKTGMVCSTGERA